MIIGNDREQSRTGVYLEFLILERSVGGAGQSVGHLDLGQSAGQSDDEGGDLVHLLGEELHLVALLLVTHSLQLRHHLLPHLLVGLGGLPQQLLVLPLGVDPQAGVL